jgi:hypothetical protein
MELSRQTVCISKVLRLSIGSTPGDSLTFGSIELIVPTVYVIY